MMREENSPKRAEMRAKDAINYLEELIVFRNEPTDEEAKALAMAIEVLTQTIWIPCSERLPEYGKAVLISFENSDDIETAIYERYGDRGAFCTSDGHCGIFPTGEGVVTAWMPLPKPYREES